MISGTWKIPTKVEGSEEVGTAPPEKILLGKYYPTDDPINTSYDEFMIFKRPLDAIEIDRYYQGTKL